MCGRYCQLPLMTSADYPSYMQYDETWNGKSVSARVNDEFQIVLLETRTAGYRWTAIHKGEPVCELLEEQNAPNTRAIGGSGTHTWRFRAVSSGTTKIQLHYQRPWKSKEEPEKTFLLEVQVRP
jgi:predicted secreted protein